MSKQNDTYQQIDDYINNVMPADERSFFEEQLANDTALKEQLELHQLANDLVLENRFSHLNDLIDSERTKANKNNKLKKGLFGASLLLIATGTYFGLTHTETLEPKSEFKQEQSITDTVQKEIVEELETTQRVDDKTTTSLSRTTPAKQKTENRPTVIKSDTLQEVIYEKPDATIVENGKTEALEKSNDNSVQAIPCKEIQFKLVASSICEGKQNGELTIKSISGGTAPYHNTILNEYNEEATNGLLSAGNYNIKLIDEKGCVSTSKDVSIDEVRCLDDYSISKAYGTHLEIPAFESPITLTVLNQNNALYFEKQFDAFEDINWDGMNRNGQFIEGYYLLLITTENGEKLNGSITLLP